ncbi:plasmid stability protein [Catenuloplanes nepalensis]|uniref:Plasmid stability protein n=1 Tax=Catenuloplanes nepalensis TaxID=587533 RepID=A0ABT9N8P9_9ACTN|nr:Arc family DNA-binding protein [Catenuloplanes nepalensis]MDP9799611.1 plasmid stability protein [Catenuloplanes nepalensis]
MAALSIRDLDDSVKDRLRLRAARHGRSMEAEVRAILTAAVADEPPTELFSALLQRFSQLGGVDDLELPARSDQTREVNLPE